MAKVGEIALRWSTRAVERTVGRSRIIQEADGEHYASFDVDVAVSPLPGTDREAGVDVGIARLATIASTDGQRIDVANPKHLCRKLRTSQRKVAGVRPADR